MAFFRLLHHNYIKFLKQLLLNLFNQNAIVDH